MAHLWYLNNCTTEYLNHIVIIYFLEMLIFSYLVVPLCNYSLLQPIIFTFEKCLF